MSIASPFLSGPDGGLGIAMSVLAGIATALAVAIMLSIHFRTGERRRGDLVRYGLGTCAVLGLLAFVIADTRQASLDYLGLNPARPAVEFEIRLPKATLTSAADAQVELLTDRNQQLAKLEDALATTDDGRNILRGMVTLDHRTTDRVIRLNLPGQARSTFRLRLPATPSPSPGFGPWHLADDLIAAAGGNVTNEVHDSFAIRYRVR